jgi:hypothetical protein
MNTRLWLAVGLLAGVASTSAATEPPAPREFAPSEMEGIHHSLEKSSALATLYVRKFSLEDQRDQSLRADEADAATIKTWIAFFREGAARWVSSGVGYNVSPEISKMDDQSAIAAIVDARKVAVEYRNPDHYAFLFMKEDAQGTMINISTKGENAILLAAQGLAARARQRQDLEKSLKEVDALIATETRRK